MDRIQVSELQWRRNGKLLCRPRLEPLEDRTVPAPLVITNLTAGVTPTQLANTLAGPGVTISNVQYIGSPRGAGLFTGGADVIGFDSGVILSSGVVNDARGPNNNSSLGTDLGQPGDATLSAIANGNTTNDASILQFDFVPQSDTLRFEFVFGSEEYNELANLNVSDIYALFVNGVNVALVPGTGTPVTIDTVNLTMNPSLYVNNAESGDSDPATPPLRDTQIDGFTVVLTAESTVNVGVTNTVRFAIADVIDTDLGDSVVFIRAGSLRAPMTPVFTALRPYRYAFRDVDQNAGVTVPQPLSGLGNFATFDGNVTLLNVGTAPAQGDFRMSLRNLPTGVQLVNRSGIDSNGNPFILVQGVDLPQGGNIPLRVPIKLSNPNGVPLSTFFIGGFFAEVSLA